MKKNIPNDVLDIAKNIFQSGEVGVIPTDTLYAISASALDPVAIEKVYQLRKREKNKPLIVLISSFAELKKFGIILNSLQIKSLSTVWPDRVSVALDCTSDDLSYLHRGKKSIAFRFPKEKWLVELLRKTGPLVAPSANISGEKPAATIAEAKKYFGQNVSFYLDGGKLKSKPSTLIKLDQSGKISVLREGAVNLTLH